MTAAPPPNRGRTSPLGRTTAGFGIAIGVIVAAAVVIAIAGNTAEDAPPNAQNQMTDRVCRIEARAIAQALQLYEDEHDGRPAPDLDVLVGPGERLDRVPSAERWAYDGTGVDGLVGGGVCRGLDGTDGANPDAPEPMLQQRCLKEVEEIVVAFDASELVTGEPPETLAELAEPGPGQLLDDAPARGRWSYDGTGTSGLVGIGECAGVTGDDG